MFIMKTSVWLLLMLVLLAVECKRYCREQDDCSSLGGLYCIKSMCEWGICSCPRGEVSRYLGSEKLFQCVPLRKVGESCSTDGEGGVCGAENSECIKGTCHCQYGHVSIWGGELCTLNNTSAWNGAGESCSASIGLCGIVNGQASSCSSTHPPNWHTEIVGGSYPTCACPDNMKLTLPNRYDKSPFIGKKEPHCEPKILGDQCFKDSDCPGTNTKCDNNVCACYNSSFIALLDGSGCQGGYTAVVPLDQPCNNSHICDGTKGMVCSTPLCQIQTTPALPDRCVCGASYTQSGSTCVQNTEGSFCYGDENCKTLPNGICEDNKCISAGVAAELSLMVAIISMATWLYLH